MLVPRSLKMVGPPGNWLNQLAIRERSRDVPVAPHQVGEELITFLAVHADRLAVVGWRRIELGENSGLSPLLLNSEPENKHLDIFSEGPGGHHLALL